MAHYALWERAIARFLERFPGLKRRIKTWYQRVQFAWHGKRGFSHCIHNAVTLVDPSTGMFSPASDEAAAPSQAAFFGYYGKSPWSHDMTRYLLHEVVESPYGTGREPGTEDGAPKKEVAIVTYDVEEGTRREIGRTRAWNYQQGAMAQWLDSSTVVYNAVEGGLLGAVCTDVQSGASTFVPWPVQAVRPQSKTWVSLNYKRLHRLRPEYGYAPEVANFSGSMPLGEDGLWLVDAETQEGRLVVSLEDLRGHMLRPEMEGAEHKVNHALYAPEGSRLVFMHRWLGSNGKFSRLFVMNEDGSDFRLLLDHRMVSHYAWLDAYTLVVWARSAEGLDQYHVLDVRTGRATVLGEGRLGTFGDGHPSASPDGRWIVTDTYPDRARQRHLLVFDRHTGRVVEVGRFLAPLAFEGPVRCDLHPRWSPDGRWLSIDSAHTGVRRSYALDVESLLQ
jgi:hypothetical protein